MMKANMINMLKKLNAEMGYLQSESKSAKIAVIDKEQLMKDLLKQDK